MQGPCVPACTFESAKAIYLSTGSAKLSISVPWITAAHVNFEL